jgi:hypothetical protein
MRTRTLAPAALALAILAAPAPAQISDVAAPKTTQQSAAAARQTSSQLQPPRPAELKPVSPLLQYAALALIAGAIIGLSIMPSKRTHQD